MIRMNVTLVLIATATASLAACGGTSTTDGQSSGGGNAAGAGGASSGSGGAGGGSAGGSSGCPETFPSHGTACSPSAMICLYDQGPCCPPGQAACVDGQWQAYASTCAAPPRPACPEQPPAEGSSCGAGACGSAYQYCAYGTCSDGSPATIAECDGATWNLRHANCLPSCENLAPCECFKRSDCQPLTGDCFCLCDYECPGEPPCDCSCGGGPFLGCESLTEPE
jgi:hypothetical protein